jgi:PAS domain S-box-containing protein
MTHHSSQDELLARLHTISKTLQHHEWSLRFLLRMALDAAVELVGAQAGSLVVAAKEGLTPAPSCYVHMDEGTRRVIEDILRERGLLVPLDQGHQVMLLDDLALPHSGDVPPRKTGPVHAFCGAAIRVNDRPFGRLYLTRDRSLNGTFREEHQHLIGILVSHAGLAIQAASLLTTLRGTRSQHVALLESTTEGVYGLDLQGRCTFINNAGATLLGYQVEDVIGQPMHELIHHHRRDGSPYSRNTCSIYQVFRTGQACRIDNEILWKKDGSSIPVEFSASPLYVSGGLQEAVITFHDITAQRHAEEIRLQLLDRALTAQEEEQRRIARELHDDTQQALTSLLVGLRTMEGAVSIDDLRNHAQPLRRIAAQALEGLQRLVQGLRPAVLDELGLEAALERLRDEFVRVYGLRVELQVSQCSGPRPTPIVESTLYRIAQEALTNAAKHAGATTVSVLLQAEASCLRLVVEDNGCGFDPSVVGKTAPVNRGLGLCGMLERAKMVDAILTVESARGRGTMIHVEVPVGKKEG